MPGTMDLVGGMLNGFVGTKNQAQQAQSMNEYRKAMTDHVKTQAKLEEQKINLAMMKAQGLPPELVSALNNSEGGGVTQPANQPNVPAIAQTPPPLADVIAQGQMPIQIPGNPANNISVRQNNPGNLKYVGQPGAQPGTRDFAIFPSPEAGFNALVNQVDIDKKRGLTLSQFGNKYAPPFENDTNSWINTVAKLTGATPSTPLANIPSNSLAAAVARVESGTRFGGGQSQPQAQIQRPATAQGGGGIDSLPLGNRLQLDAYMKQNFDLDTKFRENKDKLHGNIKDGFVIERNGRPIAQIPGRGGMTMTDVQQPDGSVMRVPVAEPPPPQLPGIPVYAPGGGQGLGPASQMFGGGGGVQTKPPEYSYQEIKTPTGATSKVAVPKAQPGISFESEPPGVKIADAGRVNMVMQANNRIDEVNKMLFPGGKVDRSLIFKASVPGGGIGEGSQLWSKMYQTVDSALRLETGAQANEQEIQTKMKEYWPSFKDTEATIKQKNKDLNEYVKGVVELNDPTGQLRKMRGKGVDQYQNQSPQTASDYLKKLQGGNQ